VLILNFKDNCKVNIYDGDKDWYQNGELHRENGPAIEYGNGGKVWYQNSELHRLDGPAIEYAGGGKEWWHNGIRKMAPKHS